MKKAQAIKAIYVRLPLGMDDKRKEGNDGTAVTVRHCRRGNGGTYIPCTMGMLTRRSKRVTAMVTG